jgi:hypothetical protein
MPRGVRARAAASAMRANAGRAAALAAAASGGAATAAPPPAARHHNHHHATEHGLTLHETLYADARGAVHYREDPRDDRRAVMGALREMEREEVGSTGLATAGSSDAGSGGALGRSRVRSPGHARGGGAAAHATRERLQPRKFVRGAKAVKHTHMVNQPRSKAQAA